MSRRLLHSFSILVTASVAALAGCQKKPPGIPSSPSGPSKGDVGATYTFKAWTTSPSNDEVAIRFAWDDGDTSEWSEWVASGESVAMSHSWSQPGTYQVSAMAKSRNGTSPSAWSDQKSVVIGGTGSLRWRLPLSEVWWTGSAPALGLDGTIYVGTWESCYLYAVNPNGTIKWRTQVGLCFTSPAIGPDGTIYVSTGAGLHALNPDGGSKWQRNAGAVGLAAAFSPGGAIYVGDSAGNMLALDDSGGEIWRYPTGARVIWSPAAVAADGSIYFLADGGPGLLFALDSGGLCKWCDTFPTPSFENITLAIGADGTIYFGDNDCGLWAVEPSGHTKWRAALDNMLYAGPVIGADGTIYTTDCSGNLYAIALDGTRKWRRSSGDVNSSCSSSPAIDANGIIYHAVHSSTAGPEYLVAVNPDGSTNWTYETQLYGESSPAIGPDGVLYVMLEWSLAAFGVSGPLANSPWPMYQHDAQHSGRANAK